MRKRGLNHNATRAQGYDALTTSSLNLLSANLFKAFFQNSKLKSLKSAVELKTLFLAPFFVVFLFSGCSKPLVQIQTQEVFIPIKCDLTLPQKPLENGSFESHRALAIYYKEVEQIARDCTKTP